MNIDVITDDRRRVEGHRADDSLRVAMDDLERASGWRLEDQGLCRGDVCVPVKDRDSLVSDGLVDLGELGAALRRPTVVDADEGIVVMLERANERAAPLDALDAPDFTLPDLDGAPWSFGELGRKKKLLVCWASW